MSDINKSEFPLEMQDFLTQVKTRKTKSTYQNNQSALIKYNKYLDEIGLSYEDVGPKRVGLWVDWMIGSEGLTENSAYQYLVAVMMFYDFYLLDKDGENPARAIDTEWMSKTAEFDKPTLEAGELRALVDSAVSMRGKALISLMASSGLRIGEAVSIKTEQVHLDDRRIEDVKTKKRDDDHERDIHFSRRTERIIREYMKGGYRSKNASGDSDYLFTSRGDEQGYMSKDRGHKEFRDAVDNCDIINSYLKKENEKIITANGNERSQITSHILRRSFCQNWVDNGGDVMSLKNAAGWKKLETAKKYLDDSVDKEKWDDYGVRA